MAIEEKESNAILISPSEKASTLTLKENALEFCEVVLLQKTNDPIDSDPNLSSKYILNLDKASSVKAPANQLEEDDKAAEDCDFCDPNAHLMENLLNEIDNEANPYVDYIRMLEKKYPKVKCDSCRNKEASGNGEPWPLASKTRRKISVNCPHCQKKVSAPQFVRHLSYCMGIGVRKRTRRSCTNS
ncbi:hypothetical protein TNCV_3381581 [Trichonephila clavipes]|nr:hypothetical protein TNCV_3381581 [Trichonephila clavipes]